MLLRINNDCFSVLLKHWLTNFSKRDGMCLLCRRNEYIYFKLFLVFKSETYRTNWYFIYLTTWNSISCWGYKYILPFMDPCIVRIFQYIFNKMQRYTLYFIWKLLYMFLVVPPPIIRSANNYLQHLVFVTNWYLWQIPDAVETVVCVSDVGWWYHPKYLEQFPNKIICVTLHFVGYVLEYAINIF
jgi:hypothetical protein